MLVLSRRSQESVTIGDQGISITILEIRGGRVRLGITAPPEVSIRRDSPKSAAVPAPLVGAR